MRDTGRTFSPGKSELFWCPSCNLPLIAEECSICKGRGRRVYLSPPGDVRLCSGAGRELLRELFVKEYGCADFLNGRIILLNKIAGLDRRDQVILDGLHIATLWFDITSESHKIDLEPAGAALLSSRAQKGIVVCNAALMKGHLKGKWLRPEQIESQPDHLNEGDNVILKMGKFAGVGVVRTREDKSRSIRIKDVVKADLQLSDRLPTLDEAVLANEDQLKRLERTALRELEDYLSRNRLPVNVSFSGGKDSLASLWLCRKARPRSEVLFINTGLEFPETVAYTREFCRAHKMKLHEIESEGSFFQQVESFGPPAKDFRWCCKTNKLGPMTSFLQQHYPKGCVTIEGRRIYESFNRSTIKAVERNPYVPSQTTLSPIRNWRALEVMLYIYWNRLEPNPLYDQDFERIGCWLCPASLQSEFARLKRVASGSVCPMELYSELLGRGEQARQEIHRLGFLALEEASAQDDRDRQGSWNRHAGKRRCEEGDRFAGDARDALPAACNTRLKRTLPPLKTIHFHPWPEPCTWWGTCRLRRISARLWSRPRRVERRSLPMATS